MMKTKENTLAELIDYAAKLSEGLGVPTPPAPGYDKGRIQTLAAHVVMTRDFFLDETADVIFDEVLKALRWERTDLDAVRHVSLYLGEKEDADAAD